MSSNVFAFDNSFFFDSFESPVDFPFENYQENSNSLIEENNDPVHETSLLDQIAPVWLSSLQLENLSRSHLGNVECSALEVKAEECGLNVNSFSYYSNSCLPRSFDEADGNADEFMQRSYSRDYFQNKRKLFLESENLSSSDRSLSTGEMRSVCSNGDLQEKNSMQTRNILFPSPLSTEKSLIGEINTKVGRYSAEERKERIDRYRAKRTHRNFNKTIKYECRKTLANNRPRIRGRFARNDGARSQILRPSRCQDEDDVWIDGIIEEDDEEIARRGSFFSRYGSIQCQNYSY